MDDNGSISLSQKDAQFRINERELRRQPANPGSPVEMAVKTVYVYVLSF